ncbi:MAG TPA: hypothetical protein DCO72_01855 [Ruminococcus sp.]|nr:hypothetical protein [Ruminococcus sp.]
MTITIANMELDYLFLTFMLYSFMGWLFETTLVSLWESGHFLNRGSLLGPYCPVYGGGAVLSVIMAYYIPNPAMLFFTSACLCIVCEYICATILEDGFHMKLWDYSGIPFNYKGRICMLGFFFFGIMTTLVSKVIQPIFMVLLDGVRPEIVNATAILLALVLAADTVFSGIAFTKKYRKLYRFYIRWHVMLNREFRSLSRAIGRKMPAWMIEDLLNMQSYILQKNRRLNEKHIEHREFIAEHKEQLEEKMEEKIERFRKS